MKHIEDAGRKRRTYIWKKTAANTLAALGGRAACCFTLLAVFIGIPLLFSFVALFVSVGTMDMFTAVLFLVGLLISAGLALLGSRMYECFDRKARFLRYVAPVREQIAVLPADEILLRGSDHRIALPNELLRAAHKGTAVPCDDLLRPNLAPTAAELQQSIMGLKT